MNSASSAGDKLRRVIVGLALESEIYNRRINPELQRLYSNPDVNGIKDLHNRLIASEDHQDREVGLWLSLAIERPALRIDVEDLIKELEEMEFILFNLLRRVEEAAQIELNYWMNYLINAAQSARDGFWMDAKIDMNLALQRSRKEAVERIKASPHFRYEIGLLQEETLRRFEELRDFAVTLDLPAERLDIILEIQSILLDLMGSIHLDQAEEEGEPLLYVAQRLNTALRYVMRRDIQLEQAEKEIELASIYLEEKTKEISDKDSAALAKKTKKRMEVLSARILS